MVGEGIGLVASSSMGTAGSAILAMLAFGMFAHMSCGSIYALVPFIDRKALGGVCGIIDAGGNIGAVAAGFLLKGFGSLPYALFELGRIVFGCAAAIRFSRQHKRSERQLYDHAVAQRSR